MAKIITGSNVSACLREKKGNTRPFSSKRWCFTLNNWTRQDILDLLEKLGSNISNVWVIGDEVGESGTPHLQGYVEFAKKTRPIQSIGMTQIHWEKAKGNRMQNIKYCTKENGLRWIKGLKIPRKLNIITNLYEWQQEIVANVQKVPDDRTIHWYWEEEGGIGKTALVKYLVHHHDALVCDGRAVDMKYLIVKYFEKKGYYPDCIIFDITRSRYNRLSYDGLESIKNGLFASTKYESSMVIMNSPHVLCFANAEPDMERLSIDRWNVVNL